MLNDDMRISSDTRQYILQTKYLNKETLEETWVSQHYFSKLESLLNFYMDMSLRKKDLTTMKEVLEEIKSLRKEIGRMFTAS